MVIKVSEKEITTFDLSEFGNIEIEEAIKLLNAIKDTDLDLGEGLKLCFNKNSGYVFLTNEDYRTFMINPDNDKLEEWFSCSYCGCEGFKDYVKDIENHETDNKKECLNWIKENLE
jgi:hypothetical protein